MIKLIFKLFAWKFLILLLLVVTFLISSCSLNLKTEKVEDIHKEIGGGIEIFFCPADDCGKIFENEVKKSQKSVHCALYDLKLKNVISALSQKSRDLDVRLVMDDSNVKDQIKGKGIVTDKGSKLMHNKFCIFDDKKIFTGSFNPTPNGNEKNNNNLVVVESKFLAYNFNDEFEELWNHKFSEGDKVRYPVIYFNGIKIENYFCPEDDCAIRVIEQIEKAKGSVYFMAFSFTHEDIADEIILKEGADVRGIFDKGQASNIYSQYGRLKSFGINVKKDSTKYKMHHKVFIIDNSTVITGSFNPTNNGNLKNDENILIIHDKGVAEKFLEEFDRLWT
jgi:phosphatidylserine/phosphatidylglycerophosphate/cardiolipin synthase-like enzyme